MAILQGDIKLLKSAVMADTSDGGGAMTGIAVIDGQSNNLFPDTSAMDRAIGRVQQRLVYGVAHVDNTDTLMGAHAIITEAPADPLVHCVLMEAGAWAEEHDASTGRIEKYLVKGPRLGPVMYDNHYAGSLQLRLITFVGASFPAGGDAVVLRNPNGDEQYVRVLKVAISTQQVAVEERGEVSVFTAQIGTCDLGQELAYDFTGPPAARTFTAANYAQVFSTSPATGAKFYGLKPLSAVGAPGDLSAFVSGGIYTPLVPAATIETPIIDVQPFVARTAVTNTGIAPLALAEVTMAIGPNAVVTAPTAITPQSVSLLAGGTTFTDNGSGGLLQGTTLVGTVDYPLGTIRFTATAPAYGTVATTLTYTPASAASMSASSAALTVTSANQGLAYTTSLLPPPGPGSLSLSYMAQGRWYELTDNFAGKLAGADSAYGVGTVNYATGSVSVTLGAIPDVGGVLLATWGDSHAAAPIDTTVLPARMGFKIRDPGYDVASLLILWSRANVNYSATVALVDQRWQLTGDATGVYSADNAGGYIDFAPSVFPDGNVTLRRKGYAASLSNFTGAGGGNYTLNGALPITPGSFSAQVLVTYPPDGQVAVGDTPVRLTDADGVVYARFPGDLTVAARAVGTINYTTGALTINSTAGVSIWVYESATGGTWDAHMVRFGYTAQASRLLPVLVPITNVSYRAGLTADTDRTITISEWSVYLPTPDTQLVGTGMVFKVGGDLYSCAGSTLRTGWNAQTGAPANTSAGRTTDAGDVVITSLPANFSNTVTWYNAAQSIAGQGTNSGVFRTLTAPLKTGVFQLNSADARSSSASDAGVLSGSFAGSVDFTRGVVRWSLASGLLQAADLRYNAVFLQYLPLEKDLLGLDTARLPLDGKVPVFRKGDKVLVHNTQTFSLPNGLTKGVAYDWGRVRTASVRVKDALGATVPSPLYTTNLDAGTITVPVSSNITPYTQPFAVEHRIEDLVVCSVADISGKLTFTRSLTHDFPLGSSFASSALVFGDLFARAYNVFEQITWTSTWSNDRIGSTILAQFNSALYPLVMTNRGSITERWALIFTSSTAFRVIGETVGEIATGNTSTNCAPGNPATQVPYFTLPALGWGNGWSAGNVLRFNTDACGTGFWAVRTVLQGPPSVESDKFALAFRGDVDRP